ncbi:ABC transporter ATP-binding protein [Tindallia californiensis]|uniref:Iron complex transport system ATP-binding protein n=1 Tax=Tindallia californiensis TaxID=159292 RepID=A0A1H3R4U6_9FIRM|nr:ABC transporter ATP-binding protein [Tindallia californiensis]SDZ20626.1 iron complex transport system ATP-binding protein [Tindallia californiensis]
MMVSVKDLSLSIDGSPIIEDISFAVENKEIIGIVGPNGSGKSTLLKTIYKTLRPDKGTILMDHQDISTLSEKETAKKMAVLKQESTIDFDFTVREMVAMGRAPHKKTFENYSRADYMIVDEMIEKVGMKAFSNRSFTTLSGGEKQRVLFARSLTQKPELLILDEPTNHLDIKYQIEVMEIISELDISILSAIHDLNIASSYCDKIILLHQGTIKSFGSPEQVLQEHVIRDIFQVENKVSNNPFTGSIHIYFLGLGSKSKRKTPAAFAEGALL